jgi:hypothetical protein
MMRIRFSVVLLWLASLVLTGILASAQPRREPAAVISGGDIGFRPEGLNGKARTGTGWSASTANGSMRRDR